VHSVRAIADDERAEQDRDADDDERVREVERRPRDEVEEVGDVPQPHAVDEIGDAAAQAMFARGSDRVPVFAGMFGPVGSADLVEEP
jgi:hypothetical protein